MSEFFVSAAGSTRLRPSARGAILAYVAPIVVALLLVAAVLRYLSGQYEPIRGAGAQTRAQRVIILACDGLRGDRLSVLGYPRPTTPTLDQLTRACAFFPNAIAPSPTALASHATLVTGVSPRTHFLRHVGRSLPTAAITLAETLKAAGFVTAAFVDSKELATGDGGGCGLEAGFDRYDDAIVPGNADVNGFARYGGALREFLERHRASRAFAYVDCRAACGPWDPERADAAALAATTPVLPRGADRFGDPMLYLAELAVHDALRTERFVSLSEMIDAYDAAVRRLDRQIGDFLRFLVEKDLFDDTLIVVTSTHGYSLFDRGLYVGNGLTAYQEEVGVPLFVKFPQGRFAGVRSDATIGLEDVYPTVCEILGARTPVEVEGKSLIARLDGSETLERVRYGESVHLAAKGVDGVDGFTFYRRSGARKWISAPRIGIGELYSRHLHRDRVGDAVYDEAADPLSLRARFTTENVTFDLAADPLERSPLSDITPALRAVVQDLAAIEERSERQRERFRFAAVEVDRPSAVGADEIDEMYRKGLISEEQRDRMLKEHRR